MLDCVRPKFEIALESDDFQPTYFQNSGNPFPFPGCMSQTSGETPRGPLGFINDVLFMNELPGNHGKIWKPRADRDAPPWPKEVHVPLKSA